MPAPTLAPQTPLAAARSGPGGYVAAMMPRLEATAAAPPTPWTRRASTNTSVPGATAAATEPTARTSRPAANVRRRPKSSETVPVDSRAAPRPMLIELRIQVRPAVPAPSVAAVLLIVDSGAVNATSVSRVPSAATVSWRPATRGACSTRVCMASRH